MTDDQMPLVSDQAHAEAATGTELSFLCPPELAGHIPYPKPAAHFAPAWFRNLPPLIEMGETQGAALRSMRACLPVSDAFALGWMLPLPFDVAMRRDASGQLMFDWADGVPFAPIDLLNPAQIGADGPPFAGELPLKFINPWRIKLPPGWSAAFLHPLNQAQLPFTCFDAVVDCDVLDTAVDVPFRWTDPGNEALLPAGTPIAQIVPFERRLAPPEADIRAETPEETAARNAAMSRKAQGAHDYETRWHRRHETEGT